MLVKDLIDRTIKLLGIEASKTDRLLLLNSYNLIEVELATDYLPLTKSEVIQMKDSKIYYSDFSKMPIRVKGVFVAPQVSAKYHLFPEYISVISAANSAVVDYSYIPDKKKEADVSDYADSCKLLFEYGICSEYCLQIGDYEQASIWHSHYSRQISSILTTKKYWR